MPKSEFSAPAGAAIWFSDIWVETSGFGLFSAIWIAKLS